MNDPRLTVSQIAKELGKSEAAVRYWIREGKLPATRAGERVYLVRRSDLERMLGNGQRPRPPAPSQPNDQDIDLASRAQRPA